MMISSVSKGLLTLGSMLVSGSLLAWPLAPAEDIEIEDITYNGSGCPIGTVAENVSDDKQAFTVTFSEYIAEAGPGISIRDGRKNCQLTLSLTVPQGWQFSIATFDYRGFAYLEDGMRADYTTKYYFQGDFEQAEINRTAYGYFDQDFEFRDVVGIESLVWSPCGVERALNVNTAVSVRNLNKQDFPWSQGVVGTDSIDGQITQVWGISWRQCN